MAMCRNHKHASVGVVTMAMAFVCVMGVDSASATVWSYWNHEPADHLRRMGHSRPSVFTVGEWLPQWYDRLHGEELISKVADCGVDTVYSHFFKGFGIKHEHAEMERTKEFAKIAHRHGVKVLGYCQFNSLYYEAMLDEVPDLEQWTARKMDGSILTYGTAYYRWSPCIESREFVDYLKKVIRYGMEEIGLDGFHFDNSYARDCHCDRCQKAFREYLAATVPDPRAICGLADFRHVRIPPKSEQGALGQERHDPMQLWRQRFRHVQLARFHKEIFDYVKSFGPDRLVLHNPAFGRYDFDARSLDVSIEPESCDFLMAENDRFIRAEPDGKLITQVVTYKLGRRFGFRVFDSTWPKVSEVDWMEPHVGIPCEADSIRRFYAQGMIYGDIVGCPWLVRSTKNGSEVIFDNPLQAEEARRAFSFYKAHRKRLYDSTPAARTHLLYATDTFYGWSYMANGFHSFVNAAERLNGEAVPYTIATEGDIASMKGGELLVLPDIRFLSKRLYDVIAAAGRRGVKMLVLGLAGLYDENGIERAKGNPVVGLAEVANRVKEIPRQFKVEMSERGIMAETQINKRGELVLHLLRPGNVSTIGELHVAIGDVRATIDAELFSLDEGCALNDVRRDGTGRTVLTIRNFRTMCSILFRKPEGGMQ